VLVFGFYFVFVVGKFCILGEEKLFMRPDKHAKNFQNIKIFTELIS